MLTLCSDHRPIVARVVLATASGLLGLILPSAAGQEAEVLALRVARIYPVDEPPIDGGILLIQAGRILAVGADLEIPSGARVLDLRNGVATPGLIDACCTVDTESPQTTRRWASQAPDEGFFQRVAAMTTVTAFTPGALEHTCGPQCGGTIDNPLHGNSGHMCCPMCAMGAPWSRTDTLSAAVPPDRTWSEQSSEVTPHRSMNDSVNLFASDFRHLARSGVTLVYVSPDSTNVIGPRGTIVRTAGPITERMVRPAADVKVSLGMDPSRRGQPNYLPPFRGPQPTLLTRRPTTRMGVDWVFRKAFYDARRAAEGLPIGGADTPSAEALPALQQILAGDIPVRIQARMQNDIFTAVRLAQEFGLRFTLEEATEAYRCLPLLKQEGIPVIFGPLYMTAKGWRANTDEVSEPRLNTPALLAEAGITFALTAQELREEEGLVRQAMVAIQQGLSPTDALRAITATPAKLLGLAGEVGVLTHGARADVVVWSEEPFSATSRPILVLVGGRIVYQE